MAERGAGNERDCASRADGCDRTAPLRLRSILDGPPAQRRCSCDHCITVLQWQRGRTLARCRLRGLFDALTVRLLGLCPVCCCLARRVRAATPSFFRRLRRVRFTSSNQISTRSTEIRSKMQVRRGTARAGGETATGVGLLPLPLCRRDLSGVEACESIRTACDRRVKKSRSCASRNSSCS